VTPRELFEKYRIDCEGSGTSGSALTATERRCQMCNKHYMCTRAIPRHSRFDVLAALNAGDLDDLTDSNAWDLVRLEREAF
jgi:hypothetical protein